MHGNHQTANRCRDHAKSSPDPRCSRLFPFRGGLFGQVKSLVGKASGARTLRIQSLTSRHVRGRFAIALRRRGPLVLEHQQRGFQNLLEFTTPRTHIEMPQQFLSSHRVALREDFKGFIAVHIWPPASGEINNVMKIDRVSRAWGKFVTTWCLRPRASGLESTRHRPSIPCEHGLSHRSRSTPSPLQSR